MPSVLHRSAAPAAARDGSATLDACNVHRAHADFVWLSLQRLGVRDDDLEDTLQEVFVVVHQRLHTFDGSSQMTTWLFGICMRVAAAYRRRAHRRREELVADVPETPSALGPEDALAAGQAQQQLATLLETLDLEKRAVFVMYEIEELSCEEIASVVGVPVGTVYSRLHAARKVFEASVARSQARQARRGVA